MLLLDLPQALVEVIELHFVAIEPCVFHMTTLLLRAGKVTGGMLLPVAAAVWDRGGLILPIYYRAQNGCGGDPGQLSLLPYRGSAVVAWAVTVTLEEVFRNIEPPEIDLLKVDVEGAEHRIFPALSTTALRRCRYVDLDNHDIRNDEFFTQRLVPWADLVGLLHAAGFVLEASGLWRRT